MTILAKVLPQYPVLKLEFLPEGSYYDIFFEANGTEKVAQIIYGDRT